MSLFCFIRGVGCQEKRRCILFFSIFLSLNNKNQGLCASKSGLDACCLTILIFLRVLNVLRVPCDHATPTFAGFKVIVYRMKGDSLQDERCRFTGRKVSVYRMKGDSLQETPENLRPATAKIGVFFLKVSVYRMKGDFCLYKNITCVL